MIWFARGLYVIAFVAVAAPIGAFVALERGPSRPTAVIGASQPTGIVITEWMYQGNGVNGGEFVEFTNIGDQPVDMAGWSFDDDHRVPGTVDLSDFGVVQPGESVILTEDPAEVFRADWGLGPEVKIIGNLGNPIGNNLGRNDEINLYDADDNLVDRLTYGDEDFPGSIRTRWFSGNPASAAALGANDPYQWILAIDGDAYGSWVSANGDVGNPGVFALPPDTDVQLYINEVVASNSSGLADEDGDYEDWIEIYNAGPSEVNLVGFGLSDNYNNPFKWLFPAVTIEPGGFLVVFASGKDRTDPEGELHTNFSIAQVGEEVILTHPSGVLLDELEPTPIPTDVSYGRQPDGVGDWYYFDAPTPGGPNVTDGFEGITSAVQFSHAAGFYAEAFELTLNTEDQDAVIYYTLNGDTPTPGGKSTQVYIGPVLIQSREGEPNGISMIPTTFAGGTFAWVPPTGDVYKITPVRAVAIRPNHLPSATGTRTYLVDEDIFERYSLPVIALTTDNDNFFDHDIGIYVPGASYVPGQGGSGNFTKRGRAWERPVHVEFFENDHSLAFAHDAGVRIHGGLTRGAPQKALRLYARSSYGSEFFEHAIFPDQPQYTQYKRFIMRPSGNDFHRTFFRDAMMQSLFAEAGLDTQAYRPAIVFLNGEYWGIHNIRERYDKHYLARTHGVDPDALDLLTRQWQMKEGSVLDYVIMMLFVSGPPYIWPKTDETDLIHDENYEHVTSQINVDDYITYFAAQEYVRNTDWPQNNIDYWRTHEEGARWRWLVFDLDFGFGYTGGPSNDAFKRLSLANQIFLEGINQSWSTVLFRALLRNEHFRRAFLNRHADLMNTIFQPDRVLDRIDQMQAVIAPEMPEQIDRWNKIVSMDQWEQDVQVMRDFAEERPQWAPFRLRAHFRGDYQGEPGEMFYVNPDFDYCWLTFENPTPERGHIRVNTVDLANHGYPWTGLYWVTNPLPLTATPAPGYRFDGFEGYPESAGDQTWHFMPQGDETLVALFSLDGKTIPGDLNGDGVVDVSDLLILLAAWGPCPTGGTPVPPCPADINGDGSVDVSDLLILLANWG